MAIVAKWEHQAIVSELERGRRQWTLKTLAQAARSFRMKMSEFMAGAGM